MDSKLPETTAEESIPRTLEQWYEEDKFWSQFGIKIYKTGEKSFKSVTQARYKAKHPTQQHDWWIRLKIEVLTHYGEEKLACIRCGFSDLRALSLDHINGGGRAERRKPGYNAGSLYLRVKNAGYPEGYQTLCMNCQLIKRDENGETSRGNNGYYKGRTKDYRGVEDE